MSCSFSIIIPVLHESELINQIIEHVYLTGSGYEIEVIVVDGDIQGGTIHAIKREDVIRIVSPKGRGTQMNRGASVAQSDILLFLHIDTELPEDAFSKISSALKKRGYGGGAFDLGIRSGRLIFRLIEKMVSVRTRLTGIPYGDQAIFIKKDIFEKMGGYKEIPLMEDVEFMRRMKRSGYRIHIIPQQVKTSPRRWEKEGIIYCTVRNWVLVTLYSLGIPPEVLVKFYYRDWNT